MKACCEAGRQTMCEWDKLWKNIIYFVYSHPFSIHFSKSNKHTSIMGGLVDDAALALSLSYAANAGLR